MAAEFSIDVDVSGVLALFDRLGAAAEKHVKEAAKVTAERIKGEAQARAKFGGTGRTREAITVAEATKGGVGYVVFVGPTSDERGTRPENLPLWLEMGTKKMHARPFLFSSARLEEGPHLRRVAEALQDAVDEVNR